MSDQSERIQTALLRFKSKRSAAGDRQVKPAQPGASSRQPIVVDEQNPAGLFLSSVRLPAEE